MDNVRGLSCEVSSSIPGAAFFVVCGMGENLTNIESQARVENSEIFYVFNFASDR